MNGRKINGYNAPICLITKSAAESLKKVIRVLYPLGLTLKVYDCYRPQSAVNDFISWSQEVDNQSMKSVFYPNEEKSEFLKKGYIAKKSSHSRGSTVDLTI
ncbi:M15 family metallopeptidase, partial [Arsenophonus endosymbiont of Bemisia tabaci]|uniref:M15 family metallopeptidase n=1 Tax=Arsenophonus endosymbiont of Bemisia tabaci TaxID=536059 RepID=UPI0030B80735